tara:strand:+ start:12553 stop:13344 length:792 start_codon:yes stop_codon:yes gene_type:complete
MSKLRFIFATLFLVFFIFTQVQASEEIKVGGYEFEPFVDLDKNMKASGLTIELIKLLNEQQSKHHFTFVPTTSRRRYQDFENGSFDMMMFENPNWEWLKRGLPIESTHTFLEGGEVYITLKKQNRSQEYFSKLRGKTIAGMRGYHYGFADFNADPKYLTSNFNMLLLDDNGDSIKLVLRDRVDIAVVTKSYLSRFLLDSPQHRARLLVSDRLDQVYSHRIIVRKSSAVTARYLGQLLRKLAGNLPKSKTTGPLKELWKRWGID